MNTRAAGCLLGSTPSASPRHTHVVTEPHLFRVILPVSDIEVAAAFYAGILGVPGDRVSPGRHYFPCGGTILACYDALAATAVDRMIQGRMVGLPDEGGGWKLAST